MKDGEHLFDFSIDADFVKGFKNEDIQEADINVNLKFIKKNRLMEMHFTLTGKVIVECDRCLDPLELDIDSSDSIYIKIEGQTNNDEGEVIFLSEEEHEINIAPFIYENIIFALPLRKIHGEDKKGNSLCNKDMLSKIEQHKSNQDTTRDPRWDNLVNLVNN